VILKRSHCRITEVHSEGEGGGGRGRGERIFVEARGE